MARKTRPHGRKRWTPIVCGAVLGAGLALSLTLPGNKALPAAVAQQPQPVVPVVAQPQGEHPLDSSLRMVNDASQMFAQVKDYTCTLVTQERIKNQLKPENVIALSMRNQPFSVYMKWLGPSSMAGQEVCYVQGKNDNKMKVRANGVAGALGFISLKIDDPKVVEHSRHTIVEAGMGNLIGQLQRMVESDRRLNKTVARYGEFEYNKRRCTRLELIRTEYNKEFYCYRTVVYFDQQTRLPVRMEAYDWPVNGGPQEGVLLECFSYVDVRFNLGLTDQVFNK